MLKDIGKDEEPSLFCQDSTSLLHAKLVLLEAVEIFDASMIILGQDSDNDFAKITRSLCKRPKMLLDVGRGLKYLAMALPFEFEFVSAVAKCQSTIRNILRVVVV